MTRASCDGSSRGCGPRGDAAQPSGSRLRWGRSPSRRSHRRPRRGRVPTPASRLACCVARGRETSGRLAQFQSAVHRNLGRCLEGADCRALPIQSPHPAQLPSGVAAFPDRLRRQPLCRAQHGVNLETGPDYDPRQPSATRGGDWALVSLATRLGSTDRVLPMIEKVLEVGSTIMLGDYQQDHPLVLMASPECHIVGRTTDGGAGCCCGTVAQEPEATAARLC